ncbi:uroporphyrinogen-III synthase [Salinibacter grassmerensis]|uniref:uroporphyrinogen-III synthase n=1 Tax=Salinibacter grassmerensis TaxID=3040353 RepID=UPI0021E92714|nr:uroporphyrinogen-III synthase [Salinibacter grassmerensis]
MSAAPDVILLRSADEEDPDRYRTACRQAGLRAVCEPVLAFEFPRQGQLRDRLASSDPYAGLIATSPRATAALDRVFSTHDALVDEWTDRLAYAVGPKTAARLRALGLRVRGADTGTADALAAQIIEADPDGPLLFLSGNRRREALPEALRAAAVPFDELVVYETHPRTDLNVPGPEQTPWLVFFSPSGLEAVTHAEGVDVQDHRLAAIGPTTAGALKAEGHVVEAVADEPSPDGLVAALQEAGARVS